MSSISVNSPEFDAQKGGSNVSKKLNQIFDARLENDKETLEALNELSLFFKENTYQSRRNLRSEIEKRSLSINEDFLTAFRKVKVVLDSIYIDVSSMNSAVQNMSLQLQATKAQTRSLIGQTTKLQAESEKLSMEEEVARAFVRSFQLTPSEMAALRETNISDEFYRAMDHVQEIRGKCRTLMNCGHQKSALDIMDQMAIYQEAGMERLYRWAQVNCRNIDSPDISRLLTQAMSRLQDRPHLFNYVVSEYCTRRRAVVVQLFIDALTRGGPGGNPRPIEMHAHDVARYIGDMLAWLHQAVPSERDNLAVLLQGCCDQPGHDADDPIQEAVSNISECVCHPLRVRVEHILSSDTPVTSLYSTNHLLRFYLDIFSQVVPRSMLVRTLTELQETSECVFLNTLSGKVRQQLLEKGDATPPDLSPPPSLIALFTLLREILSTATLAQGTEQDILKIVSIVVDPVLESVSLAASRLATTDMAVFLLNCFHHMQTTLALYPHMDDRLERLQAQSEAQLDTLTSEQASSLVANLNLGPIYTILQDQGKGPLSQIPGMEPTSLNNFLSKLETFLSMPEMLLLAQIACLQSSIHRATVQRRATEVITAIYGQLYQCVHDTNNCYDNPDQLMPHPPEQIKQALLRS